MRTKLSIGHIGTIVVLCISAVLFVLFFSHTLSPLYSIEEGDSSVYKLMGQAVLQGKMPYADIFDHKGPMLYIIEAFGQWLCSGRWGLFCLAILALFISVICWYKSACLIISPIRSLLVVLLTLFTYYLFSEQGNLTEDWNMPFISVAYYSMLSYVMNRRDGFYRYTGIIVGLCLACSFFIRPNDAVAFIGAPIIGVCIWEIKKQEISELIKWIGGIILGFAIVAVGFIVWFASHNALSDLWYGMIGFNAKYAAGDAGLLSGCVRLPKLNYIPFLVSILILCRLRDNYRFLVYMLVPTIIAAYVLLGNHAFLHYWIAWVPVLFLTFWILVLEPGRNVLSLIAICVFISMPVFGTRNWLKTPMRMLTEFKCYKEIQHGQILSGTRTVFSDIKGNDKDSIWSYNMSIIGKSSDEPCSFSILPYNNIVPCNKVPMIFMAEMDTTLLKEMDVTNYMPKYILISMQDVKPSTYSLRDSIFIVRNYTVLKTCECPNLILYQKR